MHFRCLRTCFESRFRKILGAMNSISQRGCSQIASKDRSSTYEDAIAALNGLATNSVFLQRTLTRGGDVKNVNKSETVKYLQRAGVELEDLDQLKVIHVSGTKGKGSTCALVESILRHHGIRTGFFSSPHLVSVTERIRLSGLPISRESFAKYFWEVYGRLNERADDPEDLPPYFQFLTVLSFYVFLNEAVDVAIMEVGIGGEYDCTNIVRNTRTVGITSLGLDHTQILGDTIDKIAWQKAGIIKEGSDVFTVAQPDGALEVLEKRSREKNAFLHQVPAYSSYTWVRKPNLKYDIDVQKLNISLAIQLSHNWMFHHLDDRSPNESPYVVQKNISEKVSKAIETSFWPGRCQHLRYANKNLYLDGAHTVESIQVCSKWFRDSTRDSKCPKILVFNLTGNRNAQTMIQELQKAEFKSVYFVPNIAVVDRSLKDSLDSSVTVQEQMEMCRKNEAIWRSEAEKVISSTASETRVFESVLEMLRFQGSDECDILVTGSLHLIGAFLQALEEFDRERT